MPSFTTYNSTGMESRSFSSGAYRFGFQGQEKDNEWTGQQGSHLAFKYRVHDTRIGRFLSIDPLTKDYPWNSPYAFSENRVIDGVELEGLEYVKANGEPAGPLKPEVAEAKGAELDPKFR